jgi:integrase
MASLEYIDYIPWNGVNNNSEVCWEQDTLAPHTHKLPQIFWSNGEGWAEANHWAVEKIYNQGRDLETAKSLLKHLHSYACFLEEYQLDWRHFPMTLSKRALNRFRGYLINKIELAGLSGSTAQTRMAAVIQFYRHAKTYDFIDSSIPLWNDRKVIIRHFDSIGFSRSLSRIASDLNIPNRRIIGVRLEDGLLPLSESNMCKLLEFTNTQETTELHLMLTMGFYTGARLGTITSLKIENLEQAQPDQYMKGFYLIRVGPGTDVPTKFDVQGNLLIPWMLLNKLKEYAYSPERLKREIRATKKNKSLLFLTIRGSKYSNNTVSRLMTDLRRSAMKSKLNFMSSFKFHQTRATYGTWLMKLALKVTSPAAAIGFVKEAMLHKHERTTFMYIRFLESSKGKQEAAAAFNKAFTGLANRNWNELEA